jgi:hypothetical protein
LTAVGLALVAVPAAATTVTLNIEATYARSGPFGLAYDGTNIWWSQNDGSIHEMTTNGVDTGNSILGPNWSALAWDSNTSKLATVGGGGITEFSRSTSAGVSYTTLNPVFTAIAGSPQFLTDGLDIQGQTLWWSEDVNTVNSSPLNGSGSASLFLNGPYSGVEFLTASGKDFLAVVNDGSNPRQLCLHQTDASLIGCTTLVNSRFEDLAWDGKFLWAADYYGNTIDKISLKVDGVVLGGVPEPATWMVMLLGFGLVGATLRRRGVLAA